MQTIFQSRSSLVGLLCLFTFFGSAGSPAQASSSVISESQIIRVDSEAAGGPTDLKLVLDQDNRSILSLKIYSYPNDVQTVDPAQFEKGAVLYQQNGKNIAILQSSNFDPIQGGSFNLKYLYNAITNNYRSFPINLFWANDHWAVETGDSRRQFTHMNMIPRKAMGIVIGISKIEVD